MYPVRDDLLSCCDSFVPSLSALIPQVSSCFKRERILRKTSCQDRNPNVMCEHMQLLLIYRNCIVKTKRAALFWFGCCGWELKWVTLTVWLDDWRNPCIKHYGNNVNMKMRLTQTCILTKAWFLSVLYIEKKIRHLDFDNSDTNLQHPSLLCGKIVFCNCNFHPLRCHIISLVPSPSMYLQKNKCAGLMFVKRRKNDLFR